MSSPRKPVAQPCQPDEKAPVIDPISDGFDAAALLDVDERLSYRRPGIGADVTRKLHHGDWQAQPADGGAGALVVLLIA